MGARYRNVRVTEDPTSRRLQLHFELENRSGDVWAGGDGIYLGWQLFDPETGLFITEGHWNPLSEELRPGGSTQQHVDVELPAEMGCYHVYISPLREGSGWFYHQ